MAHDSKPAAPAPVAPAAPAAPKADAPKDVKAAAAAPVVEAKKVEAPKADAGHGGHGGHGGKGDKRASGKALVAASGTAGVTELFIFHPIDTIAKRLMSYQSKIFVPGQPWAKTSETLGKVLLKSAAGKGKGLAAKYFSLFPGLGFAALYKISQRIYKFGGQPIFNEVIHKYIGDSVKKAFGEKQGKPLTNAIAGMFIGIGEIVILPFDVLKIKKQTNPEAFKGRGVLDIVLKENVKLWSGGVTTAVRNAFGSFALFGGSVVMKEYVFNLKNYNDATFMQNFASSTAGAVASIVISNPLDVIKTRIQNKNFGAGETAMTVLGKLVKQEGLTAFWKGVVPKTGIVGPKLIFSFTIAQYLTSVFSKAGF